MDYQSLNLTANLMRSDSPLYKYYGYQESGYDVESRYDRGAIGNGLLSDGAVNNAKIRNAYRAYTVVVSVLAGDGDTNDIQKAIEDTNALGGGVILIRPGTYYPTAPLVLYDNISLVGIDPYTTIIDLTNAGDLTNGGIQIIGTYVTGLGDTLTATHGSATITGSSTSFQTDGVAQGDFILFNGALYEVASVASETSLTLTKAYQGRTESSLFFEVWRSKSNISLENFTIKNGALAGTAGSGICINYADNIYVQNCIISNNTDGIYIGRAYSLVCVDTTSKDNTSNGMNISSSQQCYFLRNKCISNTASGIKTSTSLTNEIAYFVDCICNSNGLYGIYMYVSKNNFVRNCSCSNNYSHGIYLEGSTYNQIIACYCSYNGGDGVQMTNRISVTSDYNTLVQSNNSNNATYGFNFTSGANNNTGSHNVLVANGTDTWVDNGLGNYTYENL